MRTQPQRQEQTTVDIKCSCAVPGNGLQNAELYVCLYGGECDRILNKYCGYEFRKPYKKRFPW